MPLDPSVVFIREPSEAIEERREAILRLMRQDIGPELTETAERQSRQMVNMAVEKVGSAEAAFFENRVISKANELSGKKGAVYAEILNHPQFKKLLELTTNLYPLVQMGDTNKFTTQAMIMDEDEMLEDAGRESGEHILPEAIVREAIASKAGISAEQIEALLVMTQSAQDVTCVEGNAGAGKSFTMEGGRYAYEKAGYDVIGTAISWTAAKVLQASAKLSNSMALARLLNQMNEKRMSGGEYFVRPTAIIVDEAGMVDTVSMARLLRYCKESRYPVKIILTGDTLQVNPVSAGAAMEAIVERYGSAKITTIRRQVAESDRICVKLLSERKAGRVVHMMEQKESFVWAQNREDQIAKVVEDYISYRLAFPDRQALILGVDNETVRAINDRIRAALKRLGMIQPQEVADLTVTDGRKVFEASFSVGDDIVLRGNNPDLPVYKIDPNASPVDEKQWEKTDRLGVFNRNNGRIVGIRKCDNPVGSYDFIVDLIGDLAGRVIINSEKFAKESLDRPRGLPMTLNYATTIYASQGMTVDKVLFLDGDNMNFRLSYVGLSRHRDNVKVYLDQNNLHNRIDRLKQKSKKAKDDPSLMDNVQAHRFSRQAMLQEVARGWAKNSENLTATLFQNRHMRYGSEANRRNSAAYQREEFDKVKLQPISHHANNMVWNADLRATVVGEAEEPLNLTTLWLEGRNLDATALCNAAQGLVKLCAWLKEPALEAEAQAVLDQMLADRPEAGLWDIEPSADVSHRPLAQRFQTACQSVLEALNHRPAIGQEVLDRVMANKDDTLSRAMTNNVRIYTETHKTVNVDEILALEVPLQEPENLRDSDIDLERLATPLEVIPLPERAPEEASSSFLGRLFGSFLSNEDPSKAPPAPVRSHPLARPEAIAPAFGRPQVKVESKKTESTGGLPRLMMAARSWLTGNPTPLVEVPYRDEIPPVGQVLAGGQLDFTGVPKSPAAEASGLNPSEVFLQSLRGHWWTRGKYNEPRILARDMSGEIRSRYTLDGRAVSGDLYPPAIFNRYCNLDTPAYIVAGPHEMALLTESKMLATQRVDAAGNRVVDPASVPHIFWAAKGADFGKVAQELATTKTVVIIRAKDDPQQELWARQLQQRLLEQWNVRTSVHPPLPGLTPETPVLPPVTTRPRVRRN